MYNDTVTIFCQYQDSFRNVYWYPSVLRNVHLNMDKAAIMAKYGAETNDNAILNVKYHNNNEGNILIDTGKIGNEGNPICKKWLPPKEWDNQVNDEYATTITFTDGTAFDFFYKGEWPDEKMIEDADYDSQGGFYNYMNKTFDYVFAINSVGGPYSVIPHFEIMGR